MKKLTYSTIINKPRDFVFDKLTDKSIYPQWAKAWGDGMTYEGKWKKGGYMSYFDHSQGGTKVIFEDLKPNEYIRARHIAMVNPDNVEVELTDDMMKKWIGSLEEYYFKEEGSDITKFEIVMTVDEAFREMFDNAWPKALDYFKEVCESN
ncbi:SRPBCC family protein [Ulvibacterium sp.]|uniref:SRPBCC family protein n=1 Tax=Ulvibacterium sp. TaxID=2665914 RepID=UPI003BAB3A91